MVDEADHPAPCSEHCRHNAWFSARIPSAEESSSLRSCPLQGQPTKGRGQVARSVHSASELQAGLADVEIFPTVQLLALPDRFLSSPLSFPAQYLLCRCGAHRNSDKPPPHKTPVKFPRNPASDKSSRRASGVEVIGEHSTGADQLVVQNYFNYSNTQCEHSCAREVSNRPA